MAEDSDLEKTEDPSPRRLEQAREEGQVPQSRELSTFLVTMTGAATLLLLGGWMAGRVLAPVEGFHGGVSRQWARPGRTLGWYVSQYDGEIAFADAEVGRVLDALAASPLAGRTLVVVTSDHGEAFYEHGVPTHGTTLLEEQIRTAAFLRLPGPGPDSAPRVVGEPVSVLDLVPAVAHYLGLPPHGNFQGRYDILDPGYRAQGRPFLFTIQGITQEDGLLLDDWKLLENRDRRELALFDLARDPGERRNLAGSEPARRGALEQRLDALLAEQLAYYRDRGWESGWYPPRLP